MKTDIELLCAICLPNEANCPDRRAETCCLKQLQFIKPDASGKDIFEYCCVTICGFVKHNCDTCIIGTSGIVKFVKQEKRVYPSIFDFEDNSIPTASKVLDG